jgi:hypothetical protein
VAGQCLQRGLVDEILVYVLPVLLGDGIRFYSSPGLARIDLEPVSSTQAGRRHHPPVPRPQAVPAYSPQRVLMLGLVMPVRLSSADSASVPARVGGG